MQLKQLSVTISIDKNSFLQDYWSAEIKLLKYIHLYTMQKHLWGFITIMQWWISLYLQWKFARFHFQHTWELKSLLSEISLTAQHCCLKQLPTQCMTYPQRYFGQIIMHWHKWCLKQSTTKTYVMSLHTESDRKSAALPYPGRCAWGPWPGSISS
jgi:hypothetical protein